MPDNTLDMQAVYREFTRRKVRGPALVWKGERRAQLLAAGVCEDEAERRATEEACDRFAPGWRKPQALGVSDEDRPTASEESPEPAGLERGVQFPPADKASSDFLADVRWVYENYGAVVVSEAGREVRCDWSSVKAPNKGAAGLMEWAATNRNSFYKDVAGKYLSREGLEEEDARVRRDELKADHVLEVLKRYERVQEERRKEEWI